MIFIYMTFHTITNGSIAKRLIHLKEHHNKTTSKKIERLFKKKPTQQSADEQKLVTNSKVLIKMKVGRKANN